MSTKCKRVACPDGVWSREDLIGASVKVRSMLATNFSKIQDASREYTISDIYFRTTLDGKTTTIVKLKELPDLIFTWRDLEVVSLELYYD